MRITDFYSHSFHKYTGLYADKHKRNPFICFDQSEVDDFQMFCDDLNYTLLPCFKKGEVEELMIRNKANNREGYIRKVEHPHRIDYVFLSYRKDKIFYNLRDNIMSWKSYINLRKNGKVAHENIKRLMCGIYDLENFNRMSLPEFAMFLYPGLCVERVSS